MATKTQDPAQEKQPNRITAYSQDVWKEMQKVNWPSRQQLIANSVLTLVASLLIAVLIYVADQGISGLLQLIYR